jgi:hypothetical protein
MRDAGRRRDVGNTIQQPARLFASVEELLGQWDRDKQALGQPATPPPPPWAPPSRWQDYSKLNDLEKLTVLQRLELRRARARLKLAFAEECVCLPPLLGPIPEDDNGRRAESKRRAAAWARRRESGGESLRGTATRRKCATTGCCASVF